MERFLNYVWQLGRREIVQGKVSCAIIGVLSFVILTSLGAFARIALPFSPVPVTLQTFFVLLSGAVLGGNLGCLSQLSYLVLGSMGLPIFANPAGLLGPTGGYIVGFVLASLLVGRLLQRSVRAGTVRIILSMTLGSLVIYLLGVVHLSVVTGCGLKKAIFAGLLPFLPGDGAKLLGACLIYRKWQRRFRQLYP